MPSRHPVQRDDWPGRSCRNRSGVAARRRQTAGMSSPAPRGRSGSSQGGGGGGGNGGGITVSSQITGSGGSQPIIVSTSGCPQISEPTKTRETFERLNRHFGTSCWRSGADLYHVSAPAQIGLTDKQIGGLLLSQRIGFLQVLLRPQSICPLRLGLALAWARSDRPDAGPVGQPVQGSAAATMVRRLVPDRADRTMAARTRPQPAVPRSGRCTHQRNKTVQPAANIVHQNIACRSVLLSVPVHRRTQWHRMW